MIGPSGTSNSIKEELTDQGNTSNDIKSELLSQGTTLNLIKTNQTDGSQKVKIVDSSGNIINIDDSTLSLVAVSQEHHEIHEGDHYLIAGFTTLNTNATIEFTVLIGASVAPHMIFFIEGTSRTEMYIYEGTNADSDGTPVIPVNNNRNSSNTSSMTIQQDPTINSDGTLIYSQSKGLEGDNKLPAKAGIITRESEIILKHSTKYLFRIKSKDDGNIISYTCSCYENGA